MLKAGKSVLSFAVSAAIAAGTWLSGVSMTVQADTGTDLSALFTDYQPSINETVDGSGFTHPGVGLTKDVLTNAREMIRQQKEPWYTYFKGMAASDSAQLSVSPSNQSGSDSSKPAVTYFNSTGVQSKFITDALIAYTQALMYVFTGNETYRANAMHVIRLWSQMDPTQYAYYTDACIHAGIPMNRMVTAAEILRYTSTENPDLEWTAADTANFTANLITPATETFLHDQNHFMNQHLYSLLGATAGYIFTSNKARYDEAVEWYTVNSTASDPGQTGSIKQLFRLVTTEDTIGGPYNGGTPAADPQVQLVEMGRDNAHGSGDLTNVTYLADMLLAQGTKVDPAAGTVSAAPDAVGPYEFLDDRILAAADIFFKYLMGYDTEWTPVAYSVDGATNTVKDIYNYISDSYRGRLITSNCWQIYYYYTYQRGWTKADWQAKAPYFYEAFVKRLPPQYYYYSKAGAPPSNDWDGVDGGGDWWLYIPATAASEGSAMLPADQTTSTREQIEEHYATTDSNASTVTEGSTTFVRLNATESGTKISLFDQGVNTAPFGLRIRTSGTAKLNGYTLPDTGGQWVYTAINTTFGDFVNFIVTGSPGTTVDIDCIDNAAGTDLTPPAFALGSDDMSVFSYVGAPLSIDFSATDAGTSDTVTYGASGLPDGAALDAATGRFSWTPAAGGSRTFVVTASDGTDVQAKTVTLNIGGSRAAAVQEATAPYDAGTPYEIPSLQAYQAAYQQTMDMICTASDADFTAQLQTLRAAVLALRKLTPTLSDGTLDYASVCTSPQLGNGGLATLSDGNVSSRAGTFDKNNLFLTFDFGTNYKVKASKFGFQASIFADRVAGSNVYGSNDDVTWTKLTTAEVAFTQAYQTVDVDAQYQNTAYRYFKIQLDSVKPDILHDAPQYILEFSEFRIYGQRYQTNIVDSLTLSADSAQDGVVSTGSPLKVGLKTELPVKDVSIKLQGVDAPAASSDGVNWTAEATLPSGTPTGRISLSADYTGTDGKAYDEVTATTDGSSLILTDASKAINVNTLATVTASNPQWPGNSSSLPAGKVGYLLFDNDLSTFGDLTTTGGAQPYYTLDFGADTTVRLSQILLIPRANMPARMDGTYFSGSNDGVTWTKLTNPVSGSTANLWTSIGADKIDQNEYRYVRISNDTAWSGDVSEVRLFGSVDTSAASLASKITSLAAVDKTAAAIALPSLPDGYAVAVKSSSPSGIIGPDGSIAARPQHDTIVNTVLTVTKAADGSAADTAAIPVFVSGSTPAAKLDVASLADVTASSAQWVKSGSGVTPLTAAQEGVLLFNGSTADFGDLAAGNGTYTVDFGAGAAVSLSEVRFFPRSDSTAFNASRLDGAILSGSNDGTTWTQLTRPVSGTTLGRWVDQKLDAFVDTGSYRYFKLSNSTNTGWGGNVSEVEFYGYASYQLQSATLSSGAASLYQTQTTQLSLAGTYLNGKTADLSGAAVTYASSDTSVAFVDANGVVTANGTGSADITATVELDGTSVQTNAVTVHVLPILGSISATVDQPLLTAAGQTARVTVSGTLTDGSPADLAQAQVTYASSNPAVATVDANGRITAAGEGTVTVSISATLNGFTQTTAAQEPVVVDTDPPVTTASTAPQTADSGNGWFKSPVKLTLSAADTVTGVAKTEYSLDGGKTWAVYTVPILFAKDGSYTVSFRSADKAGHTEDVKTTSFKLDTAAPTVKVFGLGQETYPDSRSIVPSVRVGDTTSGADDSKTVLTIDGQRVRQGERFPLYKLPLGTHTFTAAASDLAGNTATKTVVFKTTTSVQFLKSLIQQFAKDGTIDNRGIENSLLVKLDVCDLKSFVNEVNAQSGKHIRKEAADALKRDAQYLIDRNPCFYSILSYIFAGGWFRSLLNW